MPDILKIIAANAGPSEGGASRLTIWAGRLREFIGRILNHMGFPGAIQNAIIDDVLTGRRISVHVGSLFTTISIDGRDYYFRRINGKFDGTGSGSC